MTLGTFTSGGFKEVSAANMPGFYQFCPPNAALATGAKSCGFLLKGAANMAPLPILVDMDSQVDVRQVRGTAVNTGAAAGYFPADANLIAVNGDSSLALALENLLAEFSNSGDLPANLSRVLGTTLTQSASGQLANSLSTFLNVATPTGTINSLPAAVPGGNGGLVINGSNLGAIGFATTFTITGGLIATSAANDVRLGATERNNLATALLDLANGVETSVTLRQALRAIASGVAANVGAGGSSYKALGNPGTSRLAVSQPATGERTVTPSL
jgi:hypothetical protein